MAALFGNSQSHARCDDLGRRPALPLAHRHRSDRHRPRGLGADYRGALAAGRLDNLAAAGAQHLPQQQQDRHAQAARSSAGDGARMEVFQRRDPGALSQQGLFRRRGLRRRFRISQIFRPSRHRYFAAGSGNHRRTGQGALALFTDCRCQGRSRPRQSRARRVAGQWHYRRGRSGGGELRRSQVRSGRRAEFRALLHRLGAPAA